MALELVYITFNGILDLLEEKGPDLSEEDRQRRDRRTPRIAIRHYTESAFFYLFNSGNDQALLNCCAVDHVTFRELLVLFKPVFDKYTVDKDDKVVEVKYGVHGNALGRKRDLDAVGAIGLVLYWYRTKGSVTRSVAMAFGLTATQSYRWLRFSRKVLLFVLQDHPSAKVRPPYNYEVEDYIAAIGRRYPLAGEHRVWAAIDGLKIKLEQSTNYAVQNMYYNGWVHGTFINSVFLFAPNGRIHMCTINAPGSWHDSTQASYSLYDRMREVFDRTNGKVVVDSAFNSGLPRNRDYLIKSSQHLPATATAADLRLNREATSVRQLSEHGMRMIQAQFPRLKDNMRLEDFGDRRIIQNLMVLLYNFQTAKIGINTILNTFMSETEGFGSADTPAYAFTGSGGWNTITKTANDVFMGYR